MTKLWTVKAAKQCMSRHGMSLTKQDDEYRVTFAAYRMKNKDRREANAYYTNDIEDAVKTGFDMSYRKVK